MINILFFGTPEFAIPTLQFLITSKHNIVGVVCQPDKGKKIPIKELALKNNIKVFQLEKVFNLYEQVKNIKIDLILTIAYGQFIPDSILKLPRLGSFNLHGSLLPKLRGGAPIHHAIINGEKETGISLMHMTNEMDAGDYIAQNKTIIKEEDTYKTLNTRMMLLARDLLCENLDAIIKKNYQNFKQDKTKVTFGYNILPKDEYIDFNDKMINVFNKIRGLDDKPGGHSIFNNLKYKFFSPKKTNQKAISPPGTIINLSSMGLEVSCNDYNIIINEIQKPGKKRMLISSFVNGNKDIKIGDKFGH